MKEGWCGLRCEEVEVLGRGGAAVSEAGRLLLSCRQSGAEEAVAAVGVAAVEERAAEP